VAEFEWDSEKAERNYLLHGVRFTDASTVFPDVFAICQPDETYEERMVVIGMDALGRVLFVVYEWRDETIRIIHAREASPALRKRYLEGRYEP
jgi:uncharacterized protein